jgi:hypothetical protein
MSDMPRRFKVLATSTLGQRLGVKDCYGVFWPYFGCYIVMSEERGPDEFEGCPEDDDVEWIDAPVA